jgi:hypothetical protein
MIATDVLVDTASQLLTACCSTCLSPGALKGLSFEPLV